MPQLIDVLKLRATPTANPATVTYIKNRRTPDLAGELVEMSREKYKEQRRAERGKGAEDA